MGISYDQYYAVFSDIVSVLPANVLNIIGQSPRVVLNMVGEWTTSGIYFRGSFAQAIDY